MKRFSDQLYVYSFPKNMSGLCRLKVKGEAGTRITLKHGELLKKDGRLEQGNINVYYHPVKPDEVFQMDVFTLKGTGEEDIFMPSFSYHGFQYVEVESSRPVTLTEENLTGLFMHTDVRPSGSFACSNPLLTKCPRLRQCGVTHRLYPISPRRCLGLRDHLHGILDIAIFRKHGRNGLTA